MSLRTLRVNQAEAKMRNASPKTYSQVVSSLWLSGLLWKKKKEILILATSQAHYQEKRTVRQCLVIRFGAFIVGSPMEIKDPKSISPAASPGQLSVPGPWVLRGHHRMGCAQTHFLPWGASCVRFEALWWADTSSAIPHWIPAANNLHAHNRYSINVCKSINEQIPNWQSHWE